MKISVNFSMLILGAVFLCSCASSKSSKPNQKANALFAFGIAAYKEKNYGAALSNFVKAEELEPSNPEYPLHAALALMEVERFNLAERKMQQACQMRKKFPTCWNNMSALYIKMNKPEKSIAYAKKAADEPTYNTPELAYVNMSRAQLLQNKTKEALNSAEKALRLNPRSCLALLLNAKVNNRLRLYDYALKHATKAETLCSANYKTHLWTAYLHVKNKDLASANKKIRSMRETFKSQEAVFAANEYLENINKKIPLKEPSL